MLTFDHLSKTYADGTRALSGIDISVAARPNIFSNDSGSIIHQTFLYYKG